MTPQSPAQINDVLRADFRTAQAADRLNAALQSALGLPFRYQVARLAIGRSLGVSSHPEPAGDALGKPIKGDTLFGQDEGDIALWMSLIVEHAQTGLLAKRELQDRVAAHWRRGLDMLWEDWTAVNQVKIDLVARLAAPATTATKPNQLVHRP
jgi:hypothetical protein